MSIFNLFSLMGGLALFLFGMDLMGKALEKQAGSRLSIILGKLTSSPLKGFLLGLGVTAVIQSSSATTVMVVGFVNSGIMSLRQAIGIIMGSNVGTTVTAWILSLTGLQGDSFLINLMKPSSFSPILAFIGIIMYMAAKSDKKKNIARKGGKAENEKLFRLRTAGNNQIQRRSLYRWRRIQKRLGGKRISAAYRAASDTCENRGQKRRNAKGVP